MKDGWAEKQVARDRGGREGGVGRKRTQREKGAFSQPFNRVGLAFR